MAPTYDTHFVSAATEEEDEEEEEEEEEEEVGVLDAEGVNSSPSYSTN
jgi:hypothetical protein